MNPVVNLHRVNLMCLTEEGLLGGVNDAVTNIRSQQARVLLVPKALQIIVEHV